MAATLAASVAESIYSRLNGRRMTHEHDLAPKKLLKRFAPESFDVIARLASPVLPSGKRVGYLLNAVAFAVLAASLWAGYYLLDIGFWGMLLFFPTMLLFSAILHAPSYWAEWRTLRQAAGSQILRDNTRV